MREADPRFRPAIRRPPPPDPVPLEPDRTEALSLAFRVAEVVDMPAHYELEEIGPTVLLCHGLSECWYSWRIQLGALAASGFHAVAPLGATSAIGTNLPWEAVRSKVCLLQLT